MVVTVMPTIVIAVVAVMIVVLRESNRSRQPQRDQGGRSSAQ
jgi:hypothetical protein